LTQFEQAIEALKRRPLRWLLTGSAGFIGSHLLEALLDLHQPVTSVDNFSTGTMRNLDLVRAAVGAEKWAAHRFIEGDIADAETCRAACLDCDVVLHQAALGSVPRSIADPVLTNASNVTGTLNLLHCAHAAGVKRFVYASSSSVYGDDLQMPKREERIGSPLSPYAVSKRACELYAQVAHRCYGLQTIGLRYFNVFGPRQDPNGPYAAVIPRWIDAMLSGAPVIVYGDGETSRDFCYVANAVQANLLAATTTHPRAPGASINVAVGGRASLNALFASMKELLASQFPAVRSMLPVYEDFRPGDVLHSQADITLARELLGYVATHDLTAGLRKTLSWYAERPR
jgi:UDP-N-acetylglucosamine 4-epimerase